MPEWYLKTSHDRFLPYLFITHPNIRLFTDIAKATDNEGQYKRICSVQTFLIHERTKEWKEKSMEDVAIFWDILPNSPYVNRRFGGTYHLHLQCRKSADQQNQRAAGV
jgi:hypothetical protein